MATIIGTSDPDSLTGTSGDDIIAGLGDDDTIIGGAGNDVIWGDDGVGLPPGPGLDASPVTLDIGEVRSGSVTASGNNNDQPGDSVIYDNVAQLDDGTAVYARVVLVSISDPDLNVDLTGGPGYEMLLNSGRGSSSSMAGETATIRVEFYRADTDEPVSINSTATFNDLDRNAVGDQESVTVDGGSFTAFATSDDTSLAVTQSGGAWNAAGTEANDPSDQDAWFSAEFEDQTSITFTLETRSTQSGFTFSGDLIDDPIITPIVPGNDTIFAGDGEDEVHGGAGDDEIYGGDGDDVIHGDEGNDLIDGGAGADTAFGGDDRDTFVNVGVGDTVDGNEGGDDWDTLDLTGSAPADGSLQVTYTTPDEETGFVTYYDQDHNVVGTMAFSNIEEFIPCFTPGTLIATPQGERLVESLRSGDRVITRDNGIQEIAWVGAKPLAQAELATHQHLRPVLIKAGALGNGLPERDMLVSPNHRVLMANDRTALYFDEREVLAAAKHLVDGEGIVRVDASAITYIHFMFENHEVILSDGAWTESFQPGDQALKGAGKAARSEILELFPDLEAELEGGGFSTARRSLKRHEASMLTK